MTKHSSDCAIHNAPALPVGPCSCGTMNLREELERLDDAVITGASYGFDQGIWRRMIGVLDQVDALGLAIAEAGYTWTPAMRSAYERATETVPAGSADSVQLTGQDAETMRAELLALTVAAGSASLTQEPKP